MGGFLSSSAFEPRFLGRLSYEEGLVAQETAIARVLESAGSRPPRLLIGEVLGLEHQAVVTLGKRGRPEDDLQVSEAEIRSRGVEVFASSRGGQATLHTPGQLVIYPCIHLQRLGLGVREYVERLESATIEFLAEAGITARRGPEEPGLYTSRGKIAFFGIRVSRGVASHGIALNVSNDLSLFGLIRSCGVSKESFDRMADHAEIKGGNPQPLPPLEELFGAWVRHFLAGIA